MKKHHKKYKPSIFHLIIITVVILVLFRWSFSALKPTGFVPPQDIFSPSPSPAITLKTPPPNKTLQNDYHIFQSFNNCGPASLSMALSYYGINISQEELGQQLRPYQNPQGDNDDKSVILEEMAKKAEEYNLIAYHRPNGNIDLIKLFITYDIPIITRTWLNENEDIGHYRVIKGYDSTSEQIIQDDSLQGKNLRYSIENFSSIWGKFNYEYLVLVPKDKNEIAKAILGENADFKKAWKNALRQAQDKLQKNPDDIYAKFNLSVAFYNTGDYKKSVEEFEKIENDLPFRTLWYQIEPIQAYFKLGNYEKVFSLTDRILNNYNRAFSELYLIRGEIYKKQGDMQSAKREFEKAVFYNTGLQKAHDALKSVTI
ncbi:MAG: C39 family peptidase [Candidatus Levybacteria bacterium]|nr:C39 family peptidase [Candidatus Levybacteria bacterium]